MFLGGYLALSSKVPFILFVVGVSLMILTVTEAKPPKSKQAVKRELASLQEAAPALASYLPPKPSVDCFCYDNDLKPTFASVVLNTEDASAEGECARYGKSAGLDCEYDPSLSPGYVSLGESP